MVEVYWITVVAIYVSAVGAFVSALTVMWTCSTILRDADFFRAQIKRIVILTSALERQRDREGGK